MLPGRSVGRLDCAGTDLHQPKSSVCLLGRAGGVGHGHTHCHSANCIVPYRLTRNAHFEEGASQSFAYGHVVVLSSGQLVKGGSDPTANTVVGVASEDATGVQGTKIGVYVATEDAEFLGNVQDTGTLALALIGTQVGLVLDGTNDIFRVDLSDTTQQARHHHRAL